MRAVLTGGTGFVGGAVARALRARGDEVVALVRDTSRADALASIGCQLVQGELPGTDLTPHIRPSDAVFHVGGQYRVGIWPRERPAMHRANVEATRAVLEAAEAARAGRVVYVSTLGVFGDTAGRVVDETYRRSSEAFLSYYDETKYRAHQLVEVAADRGVPLVIAMPSQVYGPGDHSEIGAMMRQAAAGTLRAKVLAVAGVCMVHVDDLADGILRVHDHGRVGESYALAGECVRLGELMDLAAEAGGRQAPRLTVPTNLLRALAPVTGTVSRLTGRGPNLREAIQTGDGVTFWASSERARRELGWEPRPLDIGLRQLFGPANG
jgi:nucleoside-diphosphate-sugar epimerase